MKINNKQIGSECLPFTIAEAGINHNGNLDMAYKMIEAAKNAGADAIKFQTFKAEDFIADPKQTYTYKSQGKEVTESMMAMFKRYELSRDEWFLIRKRCDEFDITFFSTPQNRTDLDLLLEIGVPAIKVGSDDLTNLPLLKSYSKTKLPIILSSGMSDLAEIYQALDCIGALDDYPTILCLCTSQYPTPAEDVNLLKLTSLRGAFPKLTLGFSDHTEGPLASSIAVALGACVFEKHFTLEKNLAGPDHWFSENPRGLKDWISSIKKAHSLLGNSNVKPTDSEMKMRILARRSIVAISEIKMGDLLTKDNIGLKRPGNGLPPSLLENIMGCRAMKNIIKGELIDIKDFC